MNTELNVMRMALEKKGFECRVEGNVVIVRDMAFVESGGRPRRIEYDDVRLSNLSAVVRFISARI